MSEHMIVTCMRCRGSYDMDYEEAWPDHHKAPDGTECAPDPSTCTWVTDRAGRYCNAMHDDFVVEAIEQPDDPDDD